MFESPNFWLALPEIFVMSMACAVLLIDLYLDDRRRIVTYLLTLATLAGAFALSIVVQPATTTVTFSGSFVIDDMALVLKLFIYAVSAAVFIYSRHYLEQRSLFRGEYFVLGLFGVLGMMVLVSAHSFLTIYLGLELMSLAMYAMVAMQRDSINASEAAMKYFVLSALASGMLLYGMSLLYGVSGTLDIGEFAQAIAAMEGQRTVVVSLGLVLAIIGVVFKLGAVPFHMWIPDVYHGAPTAVTLYITAAPNLAAFAMLMRLLVDGLGDLQVIWQDFFVIMAVLSMGVGNVIAIAQSNLKRMLAYSTISHVGFLFLGFLAGTAEGYAAAMFYALVYAIMSAGGFGMILLLSRAGFEADSLEDFKGLNERSPWFAAMMLILMFSMAGVPPTLGFYAKLSVLQAAIGVDLVWLAVVAIIFSIIGAFYYLRIIKLMYFDKAQDTQPLETHTDMRIVLSANGLAVLGLGLFPGSLLGLCAAVMGQAG